MRMKGVNFVWTDGRPGIIGRGVEKRERMRGQCKCEYREVGGGSDSLESENSCDTGRKRLIYGERGHIARVKKKTGG